MKPMTMLRNQPKGVLRQQVLVSVVRRCASSKLAFVVWLFIATLALGLVIPFFNVWGRMFLPLCVCVWYWKFLVFEILVVKTYFDHLFGLHKQFCLIEDHLYLGSLPFQPDDHAMLAKKLGINAVVSVMESWELDSSTIIGRPIQPKDWLYLEIDHLHIPVGEFQLLPLASLHKGADYINRLVSEGKKVFCHCRSGRHHSAVVVLAYLMKYRSLRAPEALRMLQNKRPVRFGFAAGGKAGTQMALLERYESSYRSNQRTM